MFIDKGESFMATNVSTFLELKNAIEDSTTTDISITNDITLTGGIKVNVAKSITTVDANNHTITDVNTSTFTDTIYVPSTTNTVSVTMKNAVWSGRNYYGVIGVYDGNTNVTINLENITYTGPQFSYNKAGTTKITNCNITLSQNGSSPAPQELSEANRLIISGNVTVNSNTTGNAVVWFTSANSALTVEENAVFTVNALSTYMFYTDTQPVLTFKKNSYTKMATKNGLFYSSSSSAHIALSFLLDENATFISSQSASNSAPLFKCISNFTINKNADFELYSTVSNSTGLIYFGQQAVASINSPKRVVLYNNGGPVFKFQTGSTSSPNNLTISAEMINLWTKATTPLESASTISDTPTTSWHKSLYSENVTINAKTSSSAVISVESNLAEGDTGYPITTTNFNILSANVMSMGALELKANEITDTSSSISGTTEALSNLAITYNTSTLSGAANSQGEFDVLVTKLVPVDTVVTIKSHKNFLTKTITKTSVGSVAITSVSPLQFYAFGSPANKDIIYRLDPNWTIEVTDTRKTGINWSLYAYISNLLTSNGNQIDNALIFKQNDVETTLFTTPILIHTENFSVSPNVTKIVWNASEGFLLRIDENKKYEGGDYSTKLNWNIEKN